MGMTTKIEWCDHTFNPWRGCQKVASGCVNCYAERQAKRNPGVFGTWGPNGTRVVAAESYWRQPLAWDKAAARDGVRRRVFCGSMMDVFEDRTELREPRARLANLVFSTPDLDWLLLTKRPENIERLWDSAATDWGEPGTLGLPLNNVWLGYSASTQKDLDAGLPQLLRCPAAVRFLSLEPLLGPVDLTQWLYSDDDRARMDVHYLGPFSTARINWVIVGGESGPKARPCNVTSVRSIVEQCKAAGVPVFVKQLGNNSIEPGDDFGLQGFIPINLSHPKGGDPCEWPEDLRVREFPREEIAAMTAELRRKHLAAKAREHGPNAQPVGGIRVVRVRM